jgi:molybdate transport system regulatory protein
MDGDGNAGDESGREGATGDPPGNASGGEPPGGGVSPAFDTKLHADGVSFEGDDAALLRAVDEAGSLNAAADALGRSYSRAHKRLARLEKSFGPLTESRRGGEGGGGSALTDRGWGLLARFERLRSGLTGVAEVDETVLPGEVVERTGEIVAVETAAGCLRALAPPEATAVFVTIRADTVTLQHAEAAPPAAETSVRNRFEGVVRDVERGESVVTATVDVGADRPLVALVTARSSDLLGLEPGMAVVASFKTTATRATPRE